MMVFRQEVTQEVQDDAMASMGEFFTYRDLKRALVLRGIDRAGVAYRAADRMLQKARKAGLIRYEDGWHKVRT